MCKQFILVVDVTNDEYNIQRIMLYYFNVYIVEKIVFLCIYLNEFFSTCIFQIRINDENVKIPVCKRIVNSKH